jgi:diacylglycerol kinase family enzyme
MRLTLFHNPSAGDGRHVREEFVVGLQRAGHEVRVCVEGARREDVDRCLDDPGDAVVVAGGDGSVRRVAIRLAGRNVPVAILPLGTANNIARALGLPEDPIDVIRQIDSMVPCRYDMGRMAAPWGRNFFVEGAGFGPFVRTALLLSNASQWEVFDDSHQRLARDRDILAEMIRDYAVQACEITLDGETVTRDCLAVHIMNLSTVGPRLRIAPHADPSDGCFDVVLVGERDREGLTDFVAAERQGGRVEARFPVWRSHRVRLRWPGAEIHVDDEFYQTGEPAELHAWVVPGKLTFLRPAIP